MNLLITSVGRRTKLIEYLVNEFSDIGNIVAVDCDGTAPALYVADKAYIVPHIFHKNYVPKIREICHEEKIAAVLTLIDPELSIWAECKSEFAASGIKVIVSNKDAIENCFDKLAMYRFLISNGFKAPKTYSNIADFMVSFNKKEINFPVIVKPRRGSASIGVCQANNMKELSVLCEQNNDLLIQEFLKGQEYGVDVYVDLPGKQVISAFVKKKITMRSGETDKAVSIHDNRLVKVAIELVSKLKLIGPIDIDAFVVDEEYYILEVNPRFGGGYPLAYECGENYPLYLKNDLLGIKNIAKIGKYTEGIYLMKHDSVTIKQMNELLIVGRDNRNKHVAANRQLSVSILP